jgi:signal transduction histidine kinase
MGEVARLGEADPALEIEDIDLSMLVRQETTQTEMGAHGIHVDIAADVRVQGDFALMRRLVAILLDNAVRHTPSGGAIWVSLQRERDAAVLRVDDEGPGVPEELREAVFQAFRQGGDVRDRAQPGTGIGLALAQHTVAAHRGSIHCLERPGGGARFEVRLPTIAAS